MAKIQTLEYVTHDQNEVFIDATKTEEISNNINAGFNRLIENMDVMVKLTDTLLKDPGTKGEWLNSLTLCKQSAQNKVSTFQLESRDLDNKLIKAVQNYILKVLNSQQEFINANNNLAKDSQQ